MFGLPDHIRACLFDLDGVITKTATLHAAAWKQMFDEFLRAQDGPEFVPFSSHDYDAYVDGKPRAAGTRDFLASRNISLDAAGLTRLSDRKNALVLAAIAEGKVEVFDTSVRYLHAVRGAGWGTAVVSSSANCQQVLASVRIEDLFDVRVDGVVAAAEHLPGKPKPDTFLAAAGKLGVPHQQCAVFEDALAGVAAGRAGGFGHVVGVDRVGQAEALRTHGADSVVRDLGELL
jgi:beta-phosphoglucomutase family hydrolase